MYSNFKVSVIIPVYNAEKYIKRAINSVLIQEEVSELFLIDDGSVDDSLNICLKEKQLDKRIIVLQHHYGKNRGVSASRNLGIKNANCPFIAFLDADDYYLPNRFRKAMEYFTSDNSIDGVYEAIAYYGKENKLEPFSIINPVNPSKLFESLEPIGEQVWFSGNGLTVKKTIFQNSGYFDEGLRTSEDTFLWFKMAGTAKLVAGNVDKFVAITDRHVNSLSANKALADKDLDKMLLKLFKWAMQERLSDQHLELIISKLFFNVFNFSFENKVEKFITELDVILKVFFVSPHYTIFKSKSFRRYVGNFFYYNKALQFLRLQ